MVPAEAIVYVTQDKVPLKVFSAAQGVANKFVKSDGPGLAFDFAIRDEKSSSTLDSFFCFEIFREGD